MMPQCTNNTPPKNIPNQASYPSKCGDGCVIRETFSPVKLPPNPAKDTRNLTGLPRVARDISADLYNNIQKWNEFHIQGCKIVKFIADMKSGTSEKFPSGLEEYMKELFTVVDKMQGYINALIFLKSQMKALVKLQKRPEPIFLSLTAQQLSQLTDDIIDAYKAEFKEKQYVLENIAHATKQEIMYFATCWTYQKNVNASVNLKLDAILVETGLKIPPDLKK